MRHGDLESLARTMAASEPPRGEIVIVIAPPQDQPALPDADALDDILRQALARSSVKEAVSEVASATGVARRAVYQRALALAKGGDDGARE